MNVEERTRQLSVEDGKLIDLVTAALADPNLHTDTRMRISNEIRELLRATHQDLYGGDGGKVREWTTAERDHQVSALLGAVLVDPNLHTDLRMRLHREIAQILAVRR
jgi:hypothetical protein